MFNFTRYSRRVATLLVAALWSTLLIVWPVKSAVAETGGYPFAAYNGPGSDWTQSYWTHPESGEPASPYGYYYRNCTDFVAWKLASTNGFTMPAGKGHAKDWGIWAKSYYAVDMNPKIGSVAWWGESSTNSFGHVAYVAGLNKDSSGNVISVKLEEYNWPISGGFDGVYHTRTINKNVVSGYIHFKDLEDSSGSLPTNNTVFRVLHRTEPDGTNVVYWAKEGSVFETWWRPGQTAPKHTELIRIAQKNIVDIDMHVKPGNIHLLYTATKTGIWETWWTPGGPLHHGLIIPNANYTGSVRKIQKTVQADGTEQLYAMTDAGVDEYWWRPGTGIHRSRVYTLRDPIAMEKYTGPNGKQHIYVADRAYAYEISWNVGISGIAVRQVIHISQADISDLDVSVDGDGKRRLYISQADNSVWEASWMPPNGMISYWRITGDTGVRAIQKYMDGHNHVLYVATQGGVYEYWWRPGTTSVDGYLIVSGLGDVRDFHRSNSVDGARAVYTAFGTHVAESWWFPDGGIRTNLIA